MFNTQLQLKPLSLIVLFLLVTTDLEEEWGGVGWHEVGVEVGQVP